ncbi:MAG: SRPBCC domain-containing protein [Anaerolineaceae bacterium]
MAAAPLAEPSKSPELTFTRILNAPRELVFKAWTDPKQMAQWWGPRGFTNPVCEMDVRPGGALRIVMRAPDGVEHPMTGIFREVVEPERLSFTMVARDQSGTLVLEALANAAFAEDGGKTELTVRAGAVGLVPQAAAMLDGMREGWSQSLERLAELLAKVTR